MDREKQIEEIANILWHIPNNYFLNSYNDCERIAECIYDDGGYRKQSEVVKEIFEECRDFKIRALRTENEAAKYKDRWETFYKDFKGFADNAAEINRLTERLILEIKTDTVKKMQKKIRAKSEYGTINISPWQLDQIVKEMLEENNGIH